MSDVITSTDTATSNSYLLCLTDDNNRPLIKATDGRRFIWNAQEVFRDIDPYFIHLGLNQADHPTTARTAGVYQLAARATLAQIFEAWSDNLHRLCWTQAQIIDFCLENQSWLESGFCLFFLIKKSSRFSIISRLLNLWYFLFGKHNKNFFVVHVRVYSFGLHISVNRFEDDTILNDSFKRRLLVPQL
jgi:hypothetical protein